jgi:hypothetical protein
MRRSILVLMFVWALCPTLAWADLCPECKEMMHTQDVGSCAECKGATSSGAFKLCQACSAKLGQCEACRKALGAKPAASPAPTPSPAAPSSPATPAPAPAPTPSPASGDGAPR